MTAEAVPLRDFGGRVRRWIQAGALRRKLALALTIAATLAGIATFAALYGGPKPFEPEPRTIILLLNIDLVLLLTLAAVVARRLVGLWSERRQGSAGSRLHIRMVAMFSLVAVTPVIFVSVFSVIFFSLGVQSWFSDRVATAINHSVSVAEAYLRDHRDFIRGDVLSMASAIDRVDPRKLDDPADFNKVLEDIAAEHMISEAIVFREDGKVLAKTKLSFVLEFDPVAFNMLQRASRGEVVVFTSDNEDRVRALSRLNNFVGTFLYVGRYVDPRVRAEVDKVNDAANAYQRLESELSSIQITFTMIYVTVALLLLFAAVWTGLTFANRLARPISHLVSAAERVRQGDLSARVTEGTDDDEIASLSRAFNRMTDQLGTQRAELVEANRQLDNRRRFTEAVLGGVGAGVLGLDPEGRIFLPNRSALELLATTADALIGKPLIEAVPEIAELLDAAVERPDRMAQGQVTVIRRGRARVLLVRITVENDRGHVAGYVVTFDDITDLVAAQRVAAWTDVARRIAHEIKNPLTPIQLSAERLKRKYKDEITTETEVFTNCVDTIVRQVGDIRRMVDEFSAFARMPAPVFAEEDLVGLVERAVDMQAMAHSDITFEKELPDGPAPIHCDGRQLGQALTNLLQNAIDAIHGREGSDLPPGRIVVRLIEQPDRRIIVFEDNGRGLPVAQRERLTEPYVTTRSKGTGLGLAIVKKIMEDHQGSLELEDGPSGGACVRLIFPRGSTFGGIATKDGSEPVVSASTHG
ncbi:MAG: two-component sensor histidine kinase [Rhodospirillaceae bacterium]|nr:two-component sensor histidine kinase [Rhodospirillaceae bacterium]